MSKRFSTKTNVHPEKVYIKDLNEWKGKSVDIVLSRESALKLSEGLIKAIQVAKKIDVTVFPKSKHPTITVTYLSDQK